MVTLKGSKVVIRSMDNSDLNDLYDWWNNPGFAGEYASFTPMSLSEIQEQVLKDANYFIIERREKEDEGDNGQKNNKKKIGFVAYYPIRSDYPDLYEIGYRILPEERRKGFTTEAVRLLVDHMFSSMDIERVESVTDAENIASQRVLEKNGFRREGLLRKRSKNRSDYREEFMYSLLREDRVRSIEK